MSLLFNMKLGCVCVCVRAHARGCECLVWMFTFVCVRDVSWCCWPSHCSFSSAALPLFPPAGSAVGEGQLITPALVKGTSWSQQSTTCHFGLTKGARVRAEVCSSVRFHLGKRWNVLHQWLAETFPQNYPAPPEPTSGLYDTHWNIWLNLCADGTTAVRRVIVC